MSKATAILAFISGAAAGALTAWNIAKARYERLINEEIASVKKAFFQAKNAEKMPVEATDEPYQDIVQNLGYTNYAKKTGTVEGRNDDVNKPYVISPEQFGECDDYEQVSLTYYADRILADENDNVIGDVEGLVGTDSLSRFGEYEDDSVFVRNDAKCCDYEILLDQRAYSEAVGAAPANG